MSKTLKEIEADAALCMAEAERQAAEIAGTLAGWDKPSFNRWLDALTKAIEARERALWAQPVCAGER